MDYNNNSNNKTIKNQLSEDSLNELENGLVKGFNNNIIKPVERLLFGVVDRELINIYSPENRLLSSGEFCYFLFSNTEDIHYSLIGYGRILHDRFTADMLKVYAIELICIYDTGENVYRYFNDKKFEVSTPKYPTKYKNIKMRSEFLNLKDYDVLSKRLFKINSFFVRQKFNEITELRQEYTRVIYEDIEREYIEAKHALNSSKILNPHKFNPER